MRTKAKRVSPNVYVTRSRTIAEALKDYHQKLDLGGAESRSMIASLETATLNALKQNPQSAVLRVLLANTRKIRGTENAMRRTGKSLVSRLESLSDIQAAKVLDDKRVKHLARAVAKTAENWDRQRAELNALVSKIMPYVQPKSRRRRQKTI